MEILRDELASARERESGGDRQWDDREIFQRKGLIVARPQVMRCKLRRRAKISAVNGDVVEGESEAKVTRSSFALAPLLATSL